MMGEIQHGVSACYSNGPHGYQPTMICTCGWCETDVTWQDVGAAYDEHVREVKKQEQAQAQAERKDQA